MPLFPAAAKIARRGCRPRALWQAGFSELRVVGLLKFGGHVRPGHSAAHDHGILNDDRRSCFVMASPPRWTLRPFCEKWARRPIPGRNFCVVFDHDRCRRVASE